VLYLWRSASLSTKGSLFSGRQKSGGLLRKCRQRSQEGRFRPR
jgi:hypothetical protein